MSPQRSDLVLASDIPDVELGVLVCDRLDVEADRGDRGHVLVELELVQDCCSTRVSICMPIGEEQSVDVLVFPAASSPSISRRISLDPKILFIIFDIEAPIVPVCLAVRSEEGYYEPSSPCVVRARRNRAC